MQLPTILPISPSQPAPAPVPGADGNAGSAPDGGATPFSQLLPAPAAPKAQDPKPEKKDAQAKDTTASSAEDAMAVIYSGWLAAAAPHDLPASVTSTHALPKGLALEGTAAANGKSPGALGLAQDIGAEVASKVASIPSGTVAPGATALLNLQRAVAPQAAALQPGASQLPQSPLKPASATLTKAAAITVATALPAQDAVATDPVQKVDPALGMKVARHLGSAGLGGPEKIAAQPPKSTAPSAATTRSSDKKILSTDGKELTESEDPVGIAVAKVGAAMPTSTPTERQPTALVANAPVPAVAASSNPSAGEPQGATPQQALAQRAVDAALSAAELFNTGNHQAVNLQFSVGNADLSLRVELRNGEIHTTFRTDSADLRSDLAKEWQSASPGSGTLRIAEPVFTSSGSGHSATGESASQQRGGQGRPETHQPAPSGAGSSANAQAFQSQGEAPSRTPAALSTSLHLQAFA